MSFRQFISIHEDGHVWRGETPIPSGAEGLPYLENLQRAENGAWQTLDSDGGVVGVEAFDEPLVAQSIELRPKVGILHGAYGFQAKFSLDSLVVDQWDRFHGHTTTGIAFVLNTAAQDQFFSLVDSYDDESFQWQGTRYEMPAWLSSQTPVEGSQFWTDRYTQSEDKWDLKGPSPIFTDLIPRIKLPKSRILVLGCGAGHDAHFFAQQGHRVTAVDFSAEALSRARANYGSSESLEWHESDIFKLPRDWHGSFDLVVEHTCYCAIPPEKRDALLQVWRQMLHEQGQLLGVFFAMDKSNHPPFGGSEWEIRRRLQKSFQFLMWSRWRHSAPGREGKELAVFAQRKA